MVLLCQLQTSGWEYEKKASEMYSPTKRATVIISDKLKLTY